MDSFEILKKAKKNNQLIVSDYDRTLYDPEDTHNYGHDRAISLIKTIAQKKHLGVITARASTGMKILLPPILKDKFPYSIFFGWANGTILSKITDGRIKQIYSNSLSSKDVMKIINILAKSSLSRMALSRKGVAKLRELISQNWKGYIDQKIIDACRKFDGKVFAEEAKITIVSPSDSKKHNGFIFKLRKVLGDGFYVAAGDKDFIHITKALGVDPKLTALNHIMKEINVGPKQVIVFGDMPEGNDVGLLCASKLPYTFTNDKGYKDKPSMPPYAISSPNMSPIGSVHQAIYYLLR